jgi:drug/metabolite transporter (DMT)-like permease
MHWLLISILAPALWAIVNHIDKYVLEKKLNGGSIRSLIVFSTMISLPVVIFCAIVWGNVLLVPLPQILVMVLVGFLSACAIWSYLVALQKEEATIVAPFFQLIPVFGFAIGYFTLGETLTTMQLLGSLIVLAGALVVGFEHEGGAKFRLKSGFVVLMLISSISYAVYESLFKILSLESSYIATFFWHHVGLLLIGLTLNLKKEYRNDFVDLFKNNGMAILGLNIGSELLTLLGNTLVTFAMLSAPIALVMVVTSTHPVFVFLFGIAITLILPKLGREKLSRIHLSQKIFAIVLVVIGAIMLQ